MYIACFIMQDFEHRINYTQFNIQDVEILPLMQGFQICVK